MRGVELTRFWGELSIMRLMRAAVACAIGFSAASASRAQEFSHAYMTPRPDMELLKPGGVAYFVLDAPPWSVWRLVDGVSETQTLFMQRESDRHPWEFDLGILDRPVLAITGDSTIVIGLYRKRIGFRADGGIDSLVLDANGMFRSVYDDGLVVQLPILEHDDNGRSYARWW